ncbi:MAG: hypothetical protein N2749_06915 [Clostridia bacterium]|nr:hypothetical protein [Clostridia bacterium]
MAERPTWKIQNDEVVVENFNFKWNPGFSKQQKERNVQALHEAICKIDSDAKVLEVSTKSNLEIGKFFSAFNLTLDGKRLENIFQSSKVFENGGQYIDLLDVEPRDAKRDERLKNSGRLIGFRYKDQDWKLLPKTAFYDYIYCKAVFESGRSNEIIKFSHFTDIEFNPDKSINCQARSLAICSLIISLGFDKQEVFRDIENWTRFHSLFVKG